ncbi:MAG: GyrI-like domain-containing protein [bacterium]|nr:GyrI-like domain-containing protein [bacterium]
MLKFFCAVSAVLFVAGCASNLPDVQVKTVDKMQVLFVEKQGNFSDIGNAMGMLFQYAGANGIQYTGAPFGVYYDDPKKVAPEKCRYDVCVPIAPVADSIAGKITGDIKIKEIPAVEVAFLVHKGAYNKVGPAWGGLYKWIFKNGYKPDGPGREFYLNSPQEVPEDSLLTEIQIPVKK